MGRVKRILIFVDGLTLPGMEGVSAHTVGLLDTIDRKRFDPVLFVCNRGNTNIVEIKRKGYKAVLVDESTYYNYNRCKAIISSVRPDILHSHSAYFTALILIRYSNDYKVPVILEHHDIELDYAQNYNYKHNSYQDYALERVHLNRFLSSCDFETISMRKKVPNAVTLPTLLKDKSKNKNFTRERSVAFVGNCAYPPNLEAAKYIVKNIAPMTPNIKYHLVGRSTEDIKVSSANVVLHGMRKNLDILDSCMFGVSPLFSGSGLKLKNIEYLSHGLGIIGTKINFSGYQIKPPMYVLDASDFADAINQMTHSFDSSTTELAYDLYEDEYSENAARVKINEVYYNVKYKHYKGKINVFNFDARELPWLMEFREKFEHATISSIEYVNIKPIKR